MDIYYYGMDVPTLSLFLDEYSPLLQYEILQKLVTFIGSYGQIVGPWVFLFGPLGSAFRPSPLYVYVSFIMKLILKI